MTETTSPLTNVNGTLKIRSACGRLSIDGRIARYIEIIVSSESPYARI